MLLSGVITRFFRNGNSQDGAPIRLTSNQSLAGAQVEAPYTEMTRAGRRFHGGTQILANAIAPTQAIPTTAAPLVLYNNDQQGNGLSLVMDWINVFLASGTAATGATLLATIGRPTVPPTQNATGFGSAPTSGTSRGSKGLWATGLTLPTGAAWSGLASTGQAAGANVGQGDNFADLGGRIVVPPGYALALAILSGAGTSPLYAVSAQWAEIELDLE